MYHHCDHELGSTPHWCQCGIDQDHTADEYDDRYSDSRADGEDVVGGPTFG